MPKQNKTPTNKPTLDALKNEGYQIHITHHRVCPYLITSTGEEGHKLVEDREWRRSGILNNTMLWGPTELGGATVVKFIRGEEKIIVRADCYHKDRFDRRLGVAECLKKFFAAKNYENQ